MTIKQYEVRRNQLFEYAGFWRRFAASAFDLLILLVVIRLCIFVISVLEISKGQGVPFEFSPLIYMFPLQFSVAFFILNWLYCSIQESSRFQGTLGKKMVGIYVTDNLRQRISYGKATGRYFLKVVSFIPFFWGVIIIAFNKKAQGFHDIVVGTTVLRHRQPRRFQNTLNMLGIAVGIIPATLLFFVITALISSPIWWKNYTHNRQYFQYVEEGSNLYNRTEYDESIDDFSKAIALDSSKGEAYGIRGFAYYQKGLIDKALIDWDKAIKLEVNSSFLDIHWIRGDIYKERGQYDLALSECIKYREYYGRNQDEQFCEQFLKKRSDYESRKALVSWAETSFTYNDHGFDLLQYLSYITLKNTRILPSKLWEYFLNYI